MVFGFWTRGNPPQAFWLPPPPTPSSPAAPPPFARSNYIIWRRNEITLQAKARRMLYCSRNCQLKSNTWNAEAQLERALEPDHG